MSKQIKGRIDAWIAGRGYPAAADLFAADGVELFNNIYFSTVDMSGSGWVKVGAAEITVTLDNPAEVNAKQVAALRKKLTEMRAEHQQAQNLLTQRINELLAIDNEVTV